MEFTLIETGWISILPPLMAITLVLITREVYSSLFLGLFILVLALGLWMAEYSVIPSLRWIFSECCGRW